MAYTDVKTMAANATFRTRVEVAIQEVAKYVLAGGGAPLSVNQTTNAYLAARNPLQFVDWFAYVVALDTTVIADGGTSTDAHVKAVIDAQWKTLWS